MPLTRETLERQLEIAQQRRDSIAAQLTEKGTAEQDLKRHPKWKAAHAEYRTIKRRLGHVAAKEAIGAASTSDEE